MAKITRIMVAPLAVNCYIIAKSSARCRLHQSQRRCAVRLQAATGAEVYIHEADAPMLSDSNLNLEKWITGETETTPISEYHAIHDGDTIVQDECVFHVLHTPGHTKGGVCYQLDRTLFTGDTLFRCSRGRTDFPGGSDAELYASLQRLKQLEGDYDVLPGHNETSTLSFEREHNPNLR